MTWSRRQFLTGVGVLAAVSGTAGRVVAKTLNINRLLTKMASSACYLLSIISSGVMLATIYVRQCWKKILATMIFQLDVRTPGMNSDSQIPYQ